MRPARGRRSVADDSAGVMKTGENEMNIDGFRRGRTRSVYDMITHQERIWVIDAGRKPSKASKTKKPHDGGFGIDAELISSWLILSMTGRVVSTPGFCHLAIFSDRLCSEPAVVPREGAMVHKRSNMPLNEASSHHGLIDAVVAACSHFRELELVLGRGVERSGLSSYRE